MVAFLEERISPKVTEGARGGPVGARLMTRRPSGWLDQEFLRSLVMHRYDVSHGIKTSEQFEKILELFYVVMFTPYIGFRFRDWRDYKATQANSRLTLISGATYQLQRVYKFGTHEVLRPIVKPVDGTVVVKRTRSDVVSTASASVDATTGVATISGHTSGDTYTWEGEFDVPVTFTDDEWVHELRGSVSRLFVASSSIKLEEIRLA